MQAAEDELETLGHDTCWNWPARELTIDLPGIEARGAARPARGRAILERLRVDGAIADEWLRRYRERAELVTRSGRTRPKDVMRLPSHAGDERRVPRHGPVQENTGFADPTNSSSWHGIGPHAAWAWTSDGRDTCSSPCSPRSASTGSPTRFL
ncbi:hypothetical protein QJS66_14060 [Kocuria rhizophila]|nr:hypothetical protein QJS66_14060 [Kocuria rhizophila]